MIICFDPFTVVLNLISLLSTILKIEFFPAVSPFIDWYIGV